MYLAVCTELHRTFKFVDSLVPVCSVILVQLRRKV